MDEDIRYTYGRMFSIPVVNMKRYYEFESEPLFKTKENKKNILKLYSAAMKCKELFFEQVKEDIYKEILSGRMFYKQEDNIFYNEETGLFFNINDCTEVDLLDISDALSKDYINANSDYFYAHFELKKQDDNLVRKAQMLLLQKGTLR
jgi:hypothetical protein